jgi:hypothetical protein
LKINEELAFRLTADASQAASAGESRERANTMDDVNTSS